MVGLPQIPLLRTANADDVLVQYQGPAGAMNGGSQFSLAILCRLVETLVDTANETVVASNTDGSSRGWKVSRPANTDVLAVTVYNAAGAATVRTGSLRGRGRQLICLLFTADDDGSLTLYINGTQVDAGATVDSNPVDPANGALIIGDTNTADAWELAAIAYKADTVYDDIQVGAVAESALAFGQLMPIGVSISGNGNTPDPFWDYLYDAKDLVDPTAAHSPDVTATGVAISRPPALASWPSAYARTANQPAQAPAPTANVTLDAVAVTP